MIMSIVAASFCDYRTEPKRAQYEISERHLHAACLFLRSGLQESPAAETLLYLPFTNLLQIAERSPRQSHCQRGKKAIDIPEQFPPRWNYDDCLVFCNSIERSSRERASRHDSTRSLKYTKRSIWCISNVANLGTSAWTFCLHRTRAPFPRALRLTKVRRS